MIPPPIPENEAERLAALRALGILDTLREERFDRITRLAGRVFRVPIVAISLIDQHRQWFKSAIGLEAAETGRDVAFCAYTILQDTPLIIRDASQDPRFKENPAVTQENGIRFYAGRQLHSRKGQRVGSFCIADHEPRDLSAEEIEILHELADLAQAELNEICVDDALDLLMEADRQRAEQKQMFDACMAHSPCVVFIKDEQSRIVYANDRLEEIIGRSIDELKGRRDDEWLPKEVAEQTLANDQRILETGRPEQVYEMAPTADGKMHHWLVAKFPLTTSNGRQLLAGMALDITREKEAESARRVSDERYRDIFENAGDLIVCVSKDGRYKYVNPAWYDTYGFTPEELPHLNVMDRIVPEDREHAATILQRVFNGQDLFGIQIQVLAKDGRRLFIEGNVNHSTENGQPIARGMFRNITERRAADEAMQRLMALKRAILNSANSAIISTDQNGLIRTFNSTAERWFGASADEIIEKESLTLAYDLEEISARAAELSVELGRPVEAGFEAFAAKARAGEADEREWTCIRKDGSRFPVRLSMTALRNNSGEIFGFLGVSRDITQERQVQEALLHAKEAAELANQTKSQFLANMSHEIRTPLSGILGINAMLLDTPLNSDQRQFVETIRESGESLLGIINDILDFSKVESGLIELEQTSFELPQLLAELHRLHAIRASARGLLLEMKTAPEIPSRITGDPVRLRQVLSNFISNAIKFSERGKVRVTVTRGIADHDQEMLLRFEVSDSGIGISPEARDRIFEAFQQADTSTTRRYGGSGLGLSISKQLVKLMGGQIGVNSTVGEGSTFWFTAPFNLAAEVRPEKTVELPVTPEDSLPEGLRILVAEDSAVNQLVILHELRKLGCKVEAASNGREAVEIFADKSFDLVLMDCQMPEMDGYEATTRIRDLEKPSGHTPIVAITANALTGERERCMNAGMTDYVTKPFTRETLRASVISAARRINRQIEAPAIDEDELTALRNEGEEAGIDLLAQLAEAFDFESTEALKVLEEAASINDSKMLARAAHKLKGSAGNFGAKPLQALCFELETFAKEQNLKSASLRLPVVRNEVNRVLAAIRMN